MAANSPSTAAALALIANDMQEVDKVIAARLQSSVPLVGDVARYIISAGGKRLLQKAEGYVCTIKGGVVTFKDGDWTGATPGGLIRGPQVAAMLEAAE